MSEEAATLYCTNHPNRPTSLRCSRCEKPICAKCAVLTPTGYRCRECVRGQQKVYENVLWQDYPLGIATAAILSFIGSLIAGSLGFFTIFVAPVAGAVIAEAVRFVVRRRRSQLLFRLVALAIVLGALLIPLFNLLGALLGGYFSIYSLIFQGVYVVLVTSTAYYRLSGIQIR